MKIFLVLALVAAACAEPEADPQLLLHMPYIKPVVPLVKPVVAEKPVVDATHYTSGQQKFDNGAVVPEDTVSVKLAKAQHAEAHAAAAAYKAPVVYKAPIAPVVYKAPIAPVVYKAPIAPVAPLAHHTYAPYTYPYAAHHIFKREAEAEPEADSQVLYNTPYTAGVLPYTAGVLPYTAAQTYIKPAVTYKAPVVYKAPLTTSYMAPYTYPYAGVHRVFKREAEAEPEADSQVLYNTPYTAGVYPYTAGVLPYTAAKTYIKPAVTYKAPVVYKAPLTTSYMAPYTYPYAGVHRIFKREAEAESEADSQVLYNTPYTAGVLPYTYKAGVLPYTAGVLPSTVYNAGVVPKVYSGVYPTTSYTYPYVY